MSLLTIEREGKSVPTARIEFSLLAPHNEEARLLGSFNDWREIPMTKGEDGTFRCSLDLPDGTWAYRFKLRSRSWFFKPNQWVEVVDPYATAVEPSGQNGILTLYEGKRILDHYVWEHDGVPLPPNDRIVIYELHVADFGGGGFRELLGKIDYLASLGINAVELMPVKDNPGRWSWGYNPRHFFALDPDYGTSEDMKRFIDRCHQRGIRVFVDGVYNHAETSTPLAHVDHDYWFRHEPKDANFSWGPEFDFDRYDEKLKRWPARQFVVDTVDFWVREYHLDGIRYDATRQIENYDAMRTFVAVSHTAAGPKPFYNVAEHVPQDPSVTGLEGPMDSAWHDNFYYCINEHLTGKCFDLERLKSALDGRREGFGAAINMVNYCSNHDHNHLMADLGEAGLLDDAAFARRRQGAILCFTALGQPLMWMGEEFGEFTQKALEPQSLHWALLQGERNQKLLEYYRTLIHLRTSHPALWGNNISFLYESAEQQVLAWMRWEGDTGVLAIVNFSGTPQTVTMENLPPCRWKSPFGCGLEVNGPHAVFELPAFASHLLVREG